MAEKRKIILDVDTGTDDAIAIMTAYLDPDIDLLAVCSVAGNKPLPYTTENTLRVRDVLKADFPVYRGCATAMVSTLLPSRHHGYSGQRTQVEGMEAPIEIHTDYLELPPSTRPAEREHAVWYYIDTLMKSDGDITLVPVGPLTNIAMAMRLEPEIRGKIREIVLMGGGYQRTNTTAAAEFNIWADPEAAQIVMDSGCPIRIIPLDATHQAYLTEEDAQRLRRGGTRPPQGGADLVSQRIRGYSTWQKVAEEPAAPIHDPLCVAYLVDPAVITELIPAHCQVDCGRGAAYGQTIFDIKNGRLGAKAPNCKVALGADRVRFAQILEELLEHTR